MIESGQQFRVNSVEELKEAYEHLDFYYSLENEIKDFHKGMRYVCKSRYDNTIALDLGLESRETIPNPFKQSKLKGIDKIMDDLSDEAKKLGFGVEVIFKNLDK